MARHVHPMLVDAGHTPVALVRNEDHRGELEALGAEVRLLDIEASTAEDFAEAFAGCNAVVFAAGAGADGKVERKRTVDLEGSLKSIYGARGAGIERFVQISAMAVDDSLPEDATPVWRAYIEAKRKADEALRASGLHWTILRPGWLQDGQGTRRVLIGRDVPEGDIPRADVAAVITAVLDDDATIGRQWELVGDGLLIDQAIAVAVLAEQERSSQWAGGGWFRDAPVQGRRR
ncbi:MAG: family oxidoreductase [Marmoricola sp.]|nr:family oxidoreductase [Marmoricola sp.]MCW2827811.1 family oxidoreductase [Marmoricola sp.]